MVLPPTEPGAVVSASSAGVAAAAYPDEHPDPMDDPGCELVSSDGDREDYHCRRTEQVSDGEEAGDSEPNGGETAEDEDGDFVICWYWVTIIRIGGRIVYYDEEFLFCEVVNGGAPDDGLGGRGGGRNCKEEQRDLEKEYADTGLSGWPCSIFSTANGHLIREGPGTENGRHNRYGFVHHDLASGYLATARIYGKPLDITSGYRCPNGDRWVAVDGGRGWHVFGRAVDLVPATANDKEWKALEAAAKAAGATDVKGPEEYPSEPHVHARW